MSKTRPSHNDRESQLKVYETNRADGKSVSLYRKILGKSCQMRTFVEIISSGLVSQRLHGLETCGGKALEIGAGDGWASYVLKCTYPGLDVTSSDLTDYIHFRREQYQAFFGRSVDTMILDAEAEIPCEMLESCDVVFCFSVLHHTDIERVAANIHRLLKEGGVFLGLYEPFTSRVFYRLHQRHVRRPDGVREHCFTEKEVARAFRRFSTTEFHKFYGANTRPSMKSMLYYASLRGLSRLIPFASSILPCTRNIIVTK